MNYLHQDDKEIDVLEDLAWVKSTRICGLLC